MRGRESYRTGSRCEGERVSGQGADARERELEDREQMRGRGS